MTWVEDYARVVDRLVTSCCVVTSADGEDAHGCLVASVMPVGADGELLALALAEGSRTETLVRRSGVLAVHTLTTRDSALADAFGGARRGRLAGVAWHAGPAGAPLIDGATGWVEARVVSSSAVEGTVLYVVSPVGAHAATAGAPPYTIDTARRTGLEPGRGPAEPADRHVADLAAALPGLDVARLREWGARLAPLLGGGARLLAAGNGGSAAQAEHFAAELVGRYGPERRGFSALPLSADTATLTAVANDYSYDDVFARQVRAHGRPGDILVALSTSGRSANVLRAAAVAREIGMTTWALTGAAPNPLAEACDEAVAVGAAATATVQECHLVAVHLVCAAFDAALAGPALTPAALAGPAVTPAAPAVTVAPAAAPAARPRRRGGPLVVVGDALLDRDLVGTVDRLSPEAPVPVVGDVVTRWRAGGGALAAVLAAARGDVRFVTALGDDDAAAELRGLLEDAGVEVVDTTAAGATPVKTRIRAAGRTLLMLDEAVAPGEPAYRLDGVEDVLRSAGGILVSDYGRGLAVVPALRSWLAEVAARTPVVWDPHVRGAVPVPGIRLVTPNQREAAAFAPGPGKDVAADVERARRLLAQWRVANVAVTRGAAGAVLVQDPSSPALAVPAAEVAGGDGCGAGDCFAAAAAGALARGAVPSEAVEAAVAAATAYVAAGGAATVAPRARARPGDLDEIVARTRRAGEPVVATGGCFDILHAGHVSLLRQARALGGCLVVYLNADESVTRLKGPGRPLVAATDRAAMLLAFDCVDAVVVFDEDTPAEALAQVRPDVYVKGGDYALGDIPERAAVESWGGQVVTVPYLAGYSTSAILAAVAAGGQPATSSTT
jgi:rfaE bifunctional protein nucleotidyltransferase chain/domain/rfaE bifunctional protein kinase chain/domain